MKTLVFSIFYLLFTICAISQECKYYKEEIMDDFSGLPIKVQKETQICKPGNNEIQFFYSTNHCWIHLNLLITRGGLSKVIEFNSKTPLIITLSDLSSFTLFPSIVYNATGYNEVLSLSGIGILTSTQTDHVKYSVSFEQLKLLASKSIEMIQYHFTTPNYSASIMDSSQMKIMSKEIEPSKYGKEKIQAYLIAFYRKANLNRKIV